MGAIFGTQSSRPTPVATANLRKNEAFADKEGNKLGESFRFDTDSLFEGAITTEQIREKLLPAVLYIEKKCNKYPDLKMLCTSLRNMLQNKKDLTEALFKLEDDLKKIAEQASSIILNEKDKNHESPEYKTANERFYLAGTLQRLIYPLAKKHLEAASKNILQHSESGRKRYPEKHSFFASTIQETISGTGSDNVSKLVADEIKKGFSIENALLRVAKSYRGTWVVPQTIIHRLSTHSTKDKNTEFEVLFITGSPYEYEGPDKFIAPKEILAKAIKEAHGKNCKKVSELTTPSYQKLENKLKEISERLKKNNIKKLYIVYNGHGDKDGVQDGVAVKDSKKQGAEKFLFVLNKNTDLTEDQIKELYDRYLKDIEVVTVFDSCHSGAGITAIENDKSKSQLNVLA